MLQGERMVNATRESMVHGTRELPKVESMSKFYRGQRV